jgi:hypothetical protein
MYLHSELLVVLFDDARCWRRRMPIHGFAQVGDGARVRRRAGPAETVVGLVASESQDEVRGKVVE